MSAKERSWVWALTGVSLAWVCVAFFAIAPASALVAFAAGTIGKPELVKNMAFQVGLEALVYLVFAWVVFRVASVLGLPRWSWSLGPAGYAVSIALYVAVMLLVGDTMALPKGVEWVFVAADLVASGLGAWLAVGRGAREDVADALGAPGAATPEAAADAPEPGAPA